MILIYTYIYIYAYIYIYIYIYIGRAGIPSGGGEEGAPGAGALGRFARPAHGYTYEQIGKAAFGLLFKASEATEYASKSCSNTQNTTCT